MSRETADRLNARAEGREKQINAPDNTDDPRWLRRMVKGLRRMAQRREKGHEHKLSQKKRKPISN